MSVILHSWAERRVLSQAHMVAGRIQVLGAAGLKTLASYQLELGLLPRGPLRRQCIMWLFAPARPTRVSLLSLLKWDFMSNITMGVTYWIEASHRFHPDSQTGIRPWIVGATWACVHQKWFLVFTNYEYQYAVFMGTNTSFLLGKYLGVELLMFNLRRKCQAVFKKAVQFFLFIYNVPYFLPILL